MVISAIVAAANNGVIGKAGGLPWYLPADLAHFKHLTMGQPIIMGRKTHESIGRALPGRQNIVVSHDRSYTSPGCQIAVSLDEALDQAAETGAKEAFIIGGQSIFQTAMSRIDRIYLTRVEAAIPGDKYFSYEPNLWQQLSVEEHPADTKNQYSYAFILLERKAKQLLK